LDDTIAETVARAYVIRAEEKTGSDFLSDYRKAIPLLLRTFKWQAKEKNARQVSTLSQLACCYFRLAEHEKAAEALTELCHTSRNKKDVLQKLLRLNEQAKETKDIQFVADSLIKDLIFNWSATGSKKRISQ
jgi:thioredoxin-like negative regulator of GroEL